MICLKFSVSELLNVFALIFGLCHPEITKLREFVSFVPGLPFQSSEETSSHSTGIPFQDVHHVGIFNCKLCGKSYESDRGLALHMQRHKGIKYDCQFCGKLYTQSSALNSHIRTVHKFVKCRFCKQYFPKGQECNCLAFAMSADKAVK